MFPWGFQTLFQTSFSHLEDPPQCYWKGIYPLQILMARLRTQNGLIQNYQCELFGMLMMPVESSKTRCSSEIWIPNIPMCTQGQELFATQSQTVEKLQLWENFLFKTLKCMENILKGDNLILINAGNRVDFMGFLLTRVQSCEGANNSEVQPKTERDTHT